MRVDDYVLKCVAFLGVVLHRDSTSIEGDLVGTGFFISVRSNDDKQSFLYFVTAKHNLDDSAGEQRYLSVNGRHGLLGVPVPDSVQWWTHPTDTSVDAAVLPVDGDPMLDITALDIVDLCLTPEAIRRYSIGVGNELFIAGLFKPAQGSGRNIPVVRYGNVAMLPNEKVPLEDFGDADVYLIEARSIGGISGSPVFVRETVKIPVTDNAGEDLFLLGNGRILFMGLMHGHWDVQEADKNKYSVEHNRLHGVNMGIGIVVPAVKILEIISQPGLVSMREEALRRMREKMIPGRDSTPRLDTSERGSFAELATRVFSVSREELRKRELAFKQQQKAQRSGRQRKASR